MLKPITINPQYIINEDGTVIINVRTGTHIKVGNQMKKGLPTGYKYATLIFNDHEYVMKRIAVHRLVAFAYLPVPDASRVWINHKDGDKSNNHYSNLEWTTISENIQHAHDTGLVKKRLGSDHWLYGKKHSIDTRRKMALAKYGEKHPKFKGWYIAEFKKFASLREAELATKLSKKTIYNRCKKGNPNSGFYFMPKDNTTI